MAVNSWDAGVRRVTPEHNDRTGGACLSWKEWERESFGNFSRKDPVYYSLELKRSGIRIHKRRAVLEIGFGNGSFVVGREILLNTMSVSRQISSY